MRPYKTSSSELFDTWRIFEKVHLENKRIKHSEIYVPSMQIVKRIPIKLRYLFNKAVHDILSHDKTNIKLIYKHYYPETVFD